MKQNFNTYLIFWSGVTLLLSLFFGFKSDQFIQSFYFVAFLLPVAVATSYFFSHFLVPNFLLQGKYFQFVLYFFYTVIVSLWLEMLIVVLAFMILANYQFPNLLPQSTNIIQMGFLLYLIVFADGFRHMVIQMRQQQGILAMKQKKESLEYLLIKVNRKNIPVKFSDIYLVESLSDYVKIHTKDSFLTTRARISHLQDQLPDYFLRVHRSFIVNTHYVQRFTREMICMKDQEIPISRTYKSQVMAFLEKQP
ncbi:MAG: LytR/AlgR family response regulator transcription factor [Candidatus Cyclobacteriaceae bacterium M3_2C_046]